MNPRCSQSQGNSNSNDTHTAHSISSHCISLLFKPFGLRILFFSVVKSLSLYLCVRIRMCVYLHDCISLMQSSKFVLFIHSQTSHTLTHTQSLASRQARLCTKKQHQQQQPKRIQISFSFIFVCLSIEQSHTATTVLLLLQLPSLPPTQNFQCYECMRFALYTQIHKQTTTAQPILLIIFLYAYLMLVAYRFMFCLH